MSEPVSAGGMVWPAEEGKWIYAFSRSGYVVISGAAFPTPELCEVALRIRRGDPEPTDPPPRKRGVARVVLRRGRVREEQKKTVADADVEAEAWNEDDE